jgi:ABC-type lipoprotein export system ATPase subunit
MVAGRVIRVRKLRKAYVTGGVRNEVLKGVDLDIDTGDYLAVVGRSGSGKTTLLNLVGGLDGDYEGNIDVDGESLDRMNDRRLSDYRNRNVGFIFQGFHLLEHMTCLENVRLPAAFSRERNGSSALLDKRAHEVLEMVDVPDKANALPKHLSGGQKQRIAIARALFNRPRMLICDEPTGNLDQTTGEQILELFEKLNDEGITLLVVTHDPAISRRAKRLVRIAEGLVEAGSEEREPVTPDASADPEVTT